MVYLISTILLLLPSYLIRFSIFGIPTTILEVLIYLVFLYGLWQAKKQGFRPIPLRIILPIGLLVLSLILSTIIAPEKRAALGELKGFFIDPLLVFWLIFQFVKKENLSLIFGSLIASGVFVSCYTIGQKILSQTTSDGRVIGLFGYSPNYVALYLAPITVLLIAYGLNLINKNKWFWLVGALILGVNLLAICFSGSRGGLLAIASGSAVFIIAYYWQWIRRNLYRQIIISIIIIAAFYTAWTFFRPDFSASLDSGRVVTSNNLRWQIWEASLELGQKSPLLGVGLGNFQNAFDQLTSNRGNFPEYITPMALTPHNLFLMFWLSSGISGLLAFLWLLYEFGRQLFKNQVNLASKYILLAMMTTIICYGLVESSIWKNDLSVIFWTIWGLALVL